MGPGLLLVSPSIVLIGVFVYGLIGWNWVSTSDWRAANRTNEFVGLDVYKELAPTNGGRSTSGTSSSSRSRSSPARSCSGGCSRSCSTRA